MKKALRKLSDYREYGTYILSTGKFRTFGCWERNGRPNPLQKKGYNVKTRTTRSELVRLASRLR